MQKLQYVKKKLKWWNKHTFGLLKDKKLKIWKNIQAIDKKVEDCGVMDKGDGDRKNAMLGEMDVLLQGQELHWKQKAKCKRFKECDNNSRFFHKLASGKRRRNLISKLNIHGVEVVNEDLIKDVAINFFSRLEAKDDIDRLVVDNLFTTSLDVDGAARLECAF